MFGLLGQTNNGVSGDGGNPKNQNDILLYVDSIKSMLIYSPSNKK